MRSTTLWLGDRSGSVSVPRLSEPWTARFVVLHGKVPTLEAEPASLEQVLRRICGVSRVGFGPTTCGLKVRCSTTELTAHGMSYQLIAPQLYRITPLKARGGE